jgi:hypothetical protein
VLLKQVDSWTYGALANHIWSFASNSWSPGAPQNPPYVSSTFLQPFVAKIVAPGRTVTLNTESTGRSSKPSHVVATPIPTCRCDDLIDHLLVPLESQGGRRQAPQRVAVATIARGHLSGWREH